MRGIICVLLCFFVFLFPHKAFAADADNIGVYEDLTHQLIDESDIELEKDTRKKLEAFSIADYERQMENLSVDNILGEIILLFKSGFKRPLASAASLIAVLILSSLVLQFNKNSRGLEYLSLISVLIFMSLPVSSVVAALSDAIKSACAFFSSFVPIFAGLVVAKGKALTASLTSATLLTVCQFLQQAASFLVVPLCGMQLALQIGSSFLNEMNFTSLTKSIAKCSNWVLMAVSTVFLGVLGLQTLITAPADSVSQKTIRFVAGTTVPVVGNVVAESIGAVSGALKLLSSSAAIYAIAAVCMIMLPVIVDIILWRIAVFLSRVVADTLSLNKVSQMLLTADSCFSLCLGVTVLALLLFIISVAVISLV